MKYLLLPPVWGVILVRVFSKEEIHSGSNRTTNDKLFREWKDNDPFSHFKMHIIRIDKLYFYLERNLQVFYQFIMLSRGKVVLQG
jgi:hypothetical protein